MRTVGEILQEKRLKQNRDWFLKIINELFNRRLRADKNLEILKQQLENDVISGKKMALGAAQEYLAQVFK